MRAEETAPAGGAGQIHGSHRAVPTGGTRPPAGCGNSQEAEEEPDVVY